MPSCCDVDISKRYRIMKLEEKMSKCRLEMNTDMLMYQNKKWEEYTSQQDPSLLDEELFPIFEKSFLFYQLLYMYKSYEEMRGNKRNNKDELKCLRWIAVLTNFIMVSENELF